DEKIDVAGGELALAGERLFVARILVAHAPAGERHGGVAPGEDDVGAGGQRRPHAAGRWAAHDADVGHAGGPQLVNGGGDPLHLHERAHALLHATATGGRRRPDRWTG